MPFFISLRNRAGAFLNLVYALLVDANDRLEPLYLDRRREFGLTARHYEDVNVTRQTITKVRRPSR